MSIEVQQRPRPGRVRGLTALIGVGVLVGGLAAMPPPATAAPAAPPAAPSELVVSGGFESGTTGWSASGGTFTLSDDAASGSSSGSLHGRSSFFDGLRGTLTEPLAHDGSYRVTAKIKHTEGGPTEPFGFAFCPGSGGCVAADGAIMTLAQGDWQEYALDFVPQDSANYQSGHATATFDRFQLETPWSSTVPFLLDDVSVVRLDSPAPEAASPVEGVQTKPVGDHNPLMGHKFGADPHHLVHDGRLYIYSTSDDQQYQTAQKRPDGLPVSDGGYERITTLNVISTDDMVNWVDHGAVPVAGSAGAATWAGNSWAPAAVSADLDGDGVEEVYLYFCNGGSGTGVIVGGSPLGPWDDPNGRMLISQNNPVRFPGGMWLFDPEVFVDVDGQPYLYFGGNVLDDNPYHPKSTRVVKLDPTDYTKLADPTGAGITEIDAPGMFEASSMFERDGKYYYSYSSNFSMSNRPSEHKIDGQAYPGNGEIAYMITDDPMNLTRETFAGTAFASHGKWFAGSGGNNHSDIFRYQGKDYFAYHTQVQGIAWGDALNAGNKVNYRSVHVDELRFDADGTIQEVEGTRAGVDQIKDFDPYRTFEAETLAWQLGVRTEAVDAPSTEFPGHQGNGNTVLTAIDDGDFTGVSQVDFQDGAASVTARVKPLVEGAAVEVRIDAEDGDLVATLPVDAEVGEWATLTADVSGASGVHDLFFVFTGPAGQRLMQVDTWAFEPGTAVAPEPEPEPEPFAGTVSATHAAPGEHVDVAGTGATPGGEVDITLVPGDTVLATATAADDGSYSASVPVPESIGAGEYTLVVVDRGSGARWSAGLTVSGETVAPRPELAVTFSTERVQAGGSLEVGGTGATPGGGLRVELHSEPVLLGEATADADGAFAVRVIVPSDVVVGDHEVVVVDQVSGARWSGPLTVTAAPVLPGDGSGGGSGGTTDPVTDRLPVTGTGAVLLAVAAACLLAVGSATVVAARRRLS